MPASSDPPGVLSFEDARRVVDEHALRVSPAATEEVDLLAANGRVLAETVVADRDIPPFSRSTRDGYALQASDLVEVPSEFEVVGEIKAGQRTNEFPSRLKSGQAVSIMTGAPVPDGADAVVMVEYTSQEGGRVQVLRKAAAGENVVLRGAEAKEGVKLLGAGDRLSEAVIALAASVGRGRLAVYRRPRVAVLATGDEIVRVQDAPNTSQIRNSNTYSLAAQILAAGAQPVLLPIAPDESRQLRRLVEEGLGYELLLITGGVSMGRYDLVEEVLSAIGAEFFFTGAKIQPGRPIVFGRCSTSTPAEARYFFGLPGNPVSTMVTFELFARPLIHALSGQKSRESNFLHARLKSEVRVKPGLRRFLPAVLSGKFENSSVELVAWHGSGDIAATARANCYAVIPPDREHIAEGEWIAIMMRS
ncbi:MAG TPA: gephyrin-like molybdotransferase Glp [Candidatus Sulfotelmatobacter sp.]|nr:gephyrin-like molybdotransferase Glp [Candidatus Sulfotelmatobacter sp.]